MMKVNIFIMLLIIILKKILRKKMNFSVGNRESFKFYIIYC